MTAARRILLCLALAGLGADVPTARAAGHFAPAASQPLRGVTLSLFYPEDRARIPRALDGIVSLGANTVCVLYPLEQEDVYADSVSLSTRPECSDSLILSVAREARSRGLEVSLFPLLHLRRTEAGRWRGTLAPRHWDRWFQSYGGAMAGAAALAESARASRLCVGAELVSSEGRTADWGRLIRRVRGIFRGKIFYSQNWDHAETPAFSPGLDELGLNAYFELSRRSRPTAPELDRAWKLIRRSLAVRWRGQRGGRLFTEVGYPSVEGAARAPWNYERTGRANKELQRDCLEAFFKAWAGSPAIHGAILYLWSEQEDAAGTGYSIRNKPAEAVVRRWFRAGFPREGSP